MNTEQILSIARSLIKLAGAWLILHGHPSAAHFVNSWIISGSALTLLGFVLSHFAHSPDNTSPAPRPPCRCSGPLLAIVLCVGLTLAATGCQTSGSNGAANILANPVTLKLAAENATVLTLQKQPQLLPAFQAAETAITNSIQGGALTFSGASIVSTLNGLGYGGLAQQPLAALAIDDISFAAGQFDAQLTQSQGLNSTNIVNGLSAVASGIGAGIAIYKQ